MRGNMRSLQPLKTGYKHVPGKKADFFQTRRLVIYAEVVTLRNC